MLGSDSESVGKPKHAVRGMWAHSESASEQIVKEASVALEQFSEWDLAAELVVSAVEKLNHAVVGGLSTDSESVSVGKLKHALPGADLGADSESKPLGKL